MEEIEDSCKKIRVGYEILSCKWTMRGTLPLWISSPGLGLACYWDLEQQVYGWVEHPCQAVGCTKFILNISFYLLSDFFYESYGCAFYSVNENGFMSCYTWFIRYIHVHL